ncbi:hypothetical protein ONZ43_g313 [Nemania bipapillata]|uniref:Uncharacterized protein n=1 Tax=Nemania bipapillata TaxID=110536 RepID=A0ACC2J8K5_9PEZI|nr:hypothetical protein ONZ43_g313 [Nemania bipapillata]
MKIYGLSVLSTLVLSACLPNAAAENGAVAADAGAANAGQDGNESLDQNLNGDLGNSFEDINIDPNDIQGSIGQNILDLMLAMGICNFNLNSLQGLGLGNEIQLLLQLQQLQQLQALGIINPFAVDQLIQQEILSQTFNLAGAGIIKRSIDASVKLSTRGKKRPAVLKRQCVNAEQPQDNVNGGAVQVGQDQAGQDQADEAQLEQDQANQDQANQDQANQDQADGEQAEGEEVDAEEENNAEEDNPEGIEVP